MCRRPRLSARRSAAEFRVKKLPKSDNSLLLRTDFYDESGRTFRVISREMWGVENNLSIANMDYYEFADNVDPDGVFRGFPQI